MYPCTAVMLMGYETTDEEPTCTDAAQIRYKNVVAIALKKNMLSLNGDIFEPEKAINGNDAAQILKAIDQITVFWPWWWILFSEKWRMH